MTDRTHQSAIGVVVLLLAVALAGVGCTPAGVGPVDDPTTVDADPTPATATDTDERPVVDMRDGAWDRVEPLASASGEDTADVRLRGLPSSDVDEIVWILWRRATTDEEQVFRVTQTGIDQLRHLTTGDVAGVSQQVLPAGETAIEIRVVSPDDPWELTVFGGGGSQLPDIAREDVVGAGPTWIGVSAPVSIELSLDRDEQLTLLQLYDATGSIVLDAGYTPEQVAEPIELPDEATLMLLDVDGPWRLTTSD